MSAATSSTTTATTGGVGEFVFRLVYFLAAPLLIAQLARVYPIIGILVNVGIALVVFTFAEAVRGLVARRPILGKVLGRALAIEAYYRENPPRPFLYYVLYPLLFPYWISNAGARREFVLFRGLGAAGFVILAIAAGWDYWAHWQPELGAAPFLRSWVEILVVQTIVTVMFVMPLATSIISLQLEGHRGRLFTLLGAAAVVLALAAWGWAKKRHEYVQRPTLERMVARTNAVKKRSLDVRMRALQAAFLIHMKHDEEIAKETKTETEILGAPIDTAREILAKLYRPDETMAFHLVHMKAKKGTVLILYGWGRSVKKEPIWLGLRNDGKFIDQISDLPSDAFRLMKAAAQH